MTSFPWSDVPASAAVDLLGLAAGRPAIRFELPAAVPLTAWAAQRQLALARDESFAVLARSSFVAATVIEVDRSPRPHLTQLAALLGYPKCCALFANRFGEHRLDEIATVAGGWQLRGDQRLLDVSRYSDGLALISHVPCSPRCTASLRQAQGALAIAALAPDDDWATADRWRPIAAAFGAV